MYAFESNACARLELQVNTVADLVAGESTESVGNVEAQKYSKNTTKTTAVGGC